MPTCQNCSASFPNRIVLNGKRTSLNKRKYCLACSPFGERKGHLLKRLLQFNDRYSGEPAPIAKIDCTCSLCGREYEYSKRRGHTLTKCNSCSVNTRRFSLKDKCVTYKGGACVLCGYTKCQQAIVFHHVDPSKKDFSISGNHALSWERIREELDKCVALCQNCHVEVHAGVAVIGS